MYISHPIAIIEIRKIVFAIIPEIIPSSMVDGMFIIFF